MAPLGETDAQSKRSPSAGAASLTLESFSWRYPGREAWALRDLSLSIPAGERVLVLGGSGSGKSTMLKALAGLLSDSEGGERSGSVLVDGHPVDDVPHRVGMVLQDPDSQVMLAKIGDDVVFGCENLGVSPSMMSQRVGDALGAVSLNYAVSHPTEQLSGGQKQRLALAGVLAMQPGALLLDEPTALLDPAGIVEVRQAVQAVCAKRAATVVIVEHRVDVWLDLVDRVVVFDAAGTLVADGTPHETVTGQADLLRDLGVWLPQMHAPSRRTGVVKASRVLVQGFGLDVGWRADAPHTVVGDVELTAGRVLAITGPNGSGKTALALTLGGLLAPIHGTVDAQQIAPGENPDPNTWSSPELSSRIANVFQVPEHQFVAPTVRSELSLALDGSALSAEEKTHRVEDLAARVGLTRLLEANPFTLSGGEQRRLSVASALVGSPRVVILDEPTFGQDANTWHEIVTLLGELRDQQVALAVVTHDEHLVAALADAELQLAPANPQSVTVGESEKRVPRIASVNPLAKIAAAAIISLSLIVSLDWVSAGVALVLECALLFWAGLGFRKLLKTLAPLLIAALLTGLTIMLYGQPSGTSYVQFLLVNISDGSLELAFATVLRVLALALPAVVLLATVDPTDLADALEQRTNLSPRFVVGALVAFRLLTLISADWRLLTRARRARGLGDASVLGRFTRQTFALLVLSVRRADKLSTAMQARGFGGSHARTWSRTSTFGGAEWMLIVLGVAISSLAISVSVATGSWNVVFGGAS